MLDFLQPTLRVAAQVADRGHDRPDLVQKVTSFFGIDGHELAQRRDRPTLVNGQHGPLLAQNGLEALKGDVGMRLEQPAENLERARVDEMLGLADVDHQARRGLKWPALGQA